ncbi:MAG: transposase [Planctomycetaceae bacterium]|nr:transposase [Planctomycetaceae bacterium]
MNKPEPIYTADDTRAAYQLNWSLTLFLREPTPPESHWLESLKAATEPDAVRILEYHRPDALTIQFFVSTQPQISPAQIIRSIKGRLQYVVKEAVPKLFRRNYSVLSVGAANNSCLDAYVAKQPARHPMADPKVQLLFESLQYVDESIKLHDARLSSHGQFLNSLHIVLEYREHLNIVDEKALIAIRLMIIRSCQQKGHLLGRIGLVANHMHILVGCHVDESPQDVALALMNNLAYVSGMKAMFEYSFYVGTFGSYDHAAIRRALG